MKENGNSISGQPAMEPADTKSGMLMPFSPRKKQNAWQQQMFGQRSHQAEALSAGDSALQRKRKSMPNGNEEKSSGQHSSKRGRSAWPGTLQRFVQGLFPTAASDAAADADQWPAADGGNALADQELGNDHVSMPDKETQQGIYRPTPAQTSRMHMPGWGAQTNKQPEEGVPDKLIPQQKLGACDPDRAPPHAISADIQSRVLEETGEHAAIGQLLQLSPDKSAYKEKDRGHSQAPASDTHRQGVQAERNCSCSLEMVCRAALAPAMGSESGCHKTYVAARGTRTPVLGAALQGADRESFVNSQQSKQHAGAELSMDQQGETESTNAADTADAHARAPALHRPGSSAPLQDLTNPITSLKTQIDLLSPADTLGEEEETKAALLCASQFSYWGSLDD